MTGKGLALRVEDLQLRIKSVIFKYLVDITHNFLNDVSERGG